MNIAIIGAGYVGLSTAVSFAKLGHKVQVLDKDSVKIESLAQGKVPLFEPDLALNIQKYQKSKTLSFTSDYQQLNLAKCPLIFITVGSPKNKNGSVNTTQVENSLNSLAPLLSQKNHIIIKSTVPVGFTKKMNEFLKKKWPKLNSKVGFSPEFLREGQALYDCLKPDRIILGAEDQSLISAVNNLYRPLIKKGIPFLLMDSNSAEMAKYASNALLATKISIMNEISRLCEYYQSNIDLVTMGVGTDKRIGPDFLKSGIGFGGSCFPKDLDALIFMGKDKKIPLQILAATQSTNKKQIQFFIKKLSLNLKKIKKATIWGTSFKPETDDIREAPALEVIKYLLSQNIQIQIFDPASNENVKKYFKDHKNITFFNTMYESLKKSDALIICTEWSCFQKANLQKMTSLMNNHLIFDGRNIYHPQKFLNTKFTYQSIGRGHE